MGQISVTKDGSGYSTDNEKIVAYLQGAIDKKTLGAKTAEKLERITVAKSWLLEYKNTKTVVDMLMNTYGISDATAYRDLKLMSLVFGPLMKINKDMLREIVDQMILETYKEAKEKGDRKTQSMLIKNRISLHGLDREDADIPDMSGFDFHPIIVAVLPEQVGQNPPDEDELNSRFTEWFEKNSDEAEVIENEA